MPARDGRSLGRELVLAPKIPAAQGVSETSYPSLRLLLWMNPSGQERAGTSLP